MCQTKPNLAFDSVSLFVFCAFVAIKMNICRVCRQTLQGNEMFALNYEIQTDWTISQALINLANLEIVNEDRLPQNICRVCKNLLCVCYDFRNTIVVSDKYFKGLNKPKTGRPEIKSEPIETDESCAEEQIVCEEKNILHEPMIIENVEPKVEESEVEHFVSDSNESCSDIEFIQDESEESEEKKEGYKCEECGKCFQTKSFYDDHISTHNTVKSHFCPICNKGFSMKRTLRHHMKLHSVKEVQGCNVCDKDFKKKFKIVETEENGKSTLSIIPYAWEAKGVLHWPKAKADELILDGASIPAEDWLTLKCKLKRAHLCSLAEAKNEITRLMENGDSTDTETSIVNIPVRKKRKVLLTRKRGVDSAQHFSEVTNLPSSSPSTSNNPNTLAKNNISVQSQSQVDPLENNQNGDTFSFFEQLNAQQMLSTLSVNENVPPSIIANENVQKGYLKNQEQILPTSILGNDNNLGNQEQIHTQQIFPTVSVNENVPTSILVNENVQKKILENQGQILKNQELFKMQLTNISAMMHTHLLVGNSPMVQASSDEPSTHKFHFAPVSTEIELVAFQKNLENIEFEKKLTQKLSIYCARPGSECGLNVCYSLVDHLFTRKFLTTCSWAGGSRDQGKQKVPFKIFQNVHMFFLKLVRMVDVTFTAEDCEKFFKCILRNASKRNITTSHRKSRCKRRPKNLHYRSHVNEDLVHVLAAEGFNSLDEDEEEIILSE